MKTIIACCVSLLLMSSNSFAQNEVADKAQALAPMTGKWKMESKLNGRTFYSDCSFDSNQTIVICEVYSDAQLTEKGGQTITGFDPFTDLYYYHTYNQHGFIPNELYINGDTWTFQGSVPNPEGKSLVRLVRTFIDENTQESVAYFSIAGRDFEIVEEIIGERIH